jgi:hypothetical protein
MIPDDSHLYDENRYRPGKTEEEEREEEEWTDEDCRLELDCRKEWEKLKAFSDDLAEAVHDSFDDCDIGKTSELLCQHFTKDIQLLDAVIKLWELRKEIESHRMVNLNWITTKPETIATLDELEKYTI